MNGTVIFDIQRFSIHDGPGIRTTIFFKGCPLRCSWCQNPESHTFIPEIAFYGRRCSGCMACRDACEYDAILDGSDQRLDYGRCTACGDCVSACAYDALRTAGAYWDAASLLAEIEKDKDFFMDSGGGVTLSGGEPCSHVPFLKSLLPPLKASEVHVGMETCGMFRWRDIEDLLPFLGLIYYDIKLMDPELHEKYTGSDNRVILENFTKLAKTFPHLQARMPLIPTINDSPENITATARFLEQNGRDSIHLLKYHNLGEAKLSAFQTDLKPLHLPACTPERLAVAALLFEREGITAEIME